MRHQTPDWHYPEADVSRLELKVPPVLVTTAFALLMWLVSLFLPGFATPKPFRLLSFAALMSIGAYVAISGVVSFRKARTTVNPLTPGEATSLVTSGIYKRTRNPMYVGLFFLLLGWGLLLSNLYSLALSVGFVLYMNRFQIRREERALESAFGSGFSLYRNRVRRWL
jgi:protein-S-isoprenylcysteine O-methyltransferase Ste14